MHSERGTSTDWFVLLFSVDPNKTAIERAFELAKSGRAGSVDEIRRSLTSEGYSTHHLTGATSSPSFAPHSRRARRSQPILNVAFPFSGRFERVAQVAIRTSEKQGECAEVSDGRMTSSSSLMMHLMHSRTAPAG